MRFIVLVIAVIGIVSVAFGNRRNHGVLTKARFDKTPQRNPRERRSKCESNFRRHARDENGFVSAAQAFLLRFCNVDGLRGYANSPLPVALRTRTGRSMFGANRRMHIKPDSLPTGHDGIVPRLHKGPTIHSSAWVVPGATVLGDVILEEESSIWYGAVLRGDINRIIIGPRSNVQDNAVVHVDTGYPTSVGELVTIGHTA